MKQLYFFMIVVAFLSCNPQEVNQSPLNSYFETSDVSVKTENRILKIDVFNSKLVKRKKESMGDRWISAEPIASVAAVNALDILKNKNDKNIDTIAFTIDVNNQKERYSFPYWQVKQVEADFDICKDLGKIAEKWDFEQIKPFLGKRILETATKEQIEAFFKKIFLQEEINRTELIGFKAARGTITLYVDYYYKSGPQTYAITFSLVNDGKIDGIALPE